MASWPASAADGRAVERATYLGTSDYDQAFFVQLGSEGGVYVLGQTLGAWPVSAGVYSNAGSRQFIQKLSPDLDKALISTVFGSGRNTLDISPTAFLVDQCDRVYACGWGGMINQGVYNYRGFNDRNGSTDGMPTTANAVRTVPDTPGFGSDFYLAQFAPGLAGLSYATFYGDAGYGSEGDHVDGGTSRFDPRGIVYAAACSCFNHAGFPVPPGAFSYSTVNGSKPLPGYDVLCNNAAFKLNFEPTVAAVGPSQALCDTSPPLKLSGTPAGGTWAGPGVSGSVATGFIFTPTPALAGSQVLTYTVPGATLLCTATAQLTILVEHPAAGRGRRPARRVCQRRPGAAHRRLAGRWHLERAGREQPRRGHLRLHPYPRPGRPPGFDLYPAREPGLRHARQPGPRHHQGARHRHAGRGPRYGAVPRQRAAIPAAGRAGGRHLERAGRDGGWRVYAAGRAGHVCADVHRGHGGQLPGGGHAARHAAGRTGAGPGAGAGAVRGRARWPRWWCIFSRMRPPYPPARC